MRSIFRLFLSASLGVGLAFVADRLFPGVQKVPVVDTSEKRDNPVDRETSLPKSFVTNDALVASPGAQPGNAPLPLRFRGYALRGDRVNVLMQSGEVRTERDGVDLLRRNFAEVDGHRYYLVAPESSSPALAPALPPPVAEQTPAENAPPLPPPPPEPESAWATHSDGVQRLKNPDTLSAMFSR